MYNTPHPIFKQLVPSENISGINLLLYVVQADIVAVGNDCIAHALELVQVVHDLATKEGLAVVESRLVDHDLGALSLDALHDALDGGLAEVV